MHLQIKIHFSLEETTKRLHSFVMTLSHGSQPYIPNTITDTFHSAH